MTRSGMSLALVLILSGVASAAPKAKGKAKAAAEPPAASAEAINELKGDFKWGMSPDQVLTEVQNRIRDSYNERLQKTAHDPTRHDRIRKEMMAELDKAKSKLMKFDGQKSGYDVSIIDQEFLHNAGESMLAAKEPTSTRYFFFVDDRLYKMFIAFDKDMLQGKAFPEFGQLMQAKFGKAKEVTVEEKTKAGVQVKLDHYVWSSKSGDMLRLVDRSEFYDVYCLVIYDGAVARRQDEIRKSRPQAAKRDAVVDAVTSGATNDLDAHDNIVDQITGKTPLKPGETKGNITVPSRQAPPPVEETNTKQPASKRSKAGKDKTGDGLNL